MRRDGPGARHVARHVAGRLGREAGHSARALERVDGGGSPKRRDGPGGRRVADPTGLRRSPVSLVLGWGDVAERGVQPLVVEPADPLDDRQLGLLVGAPDAVGDQLGLEAVDERFRERVVLTIAGRAERPGDVVVIERLRVVV